ncbi:ATP-dependent sacrificial sulfur transferase LarE [Crateriforma spongiae]|uniref:ATP-dependent sacrificial sulfur transferase LarE n=1 Tax=Crateriforma spongiae TaxID=2724528 RepID=UPI001444B966|nr:ATP-dependent sacrificial sulfur transferase LarE [Crateriforma spongiae]
MTAPTDTIDRDTQATADALVQRIGQLGHVIVAFSGGVDSSVVAAAAHRSTADAIAVTAVSPSVPAWQRDLAVRIAAQIGIDHQWVETGEIADPDYVRNDARRCFHCKTNLYDSLGHIRRAMAPQGGATILSGTNADDLGDYRPGIQAGRDHDIVTPLANLGIGKAMVRQVADHFGLENADLPASPCLASRLAYGVSVTPERLAMVESAEDWLRGQGFSDLRVRLHPGGLARVEVPRSELPRLAGTELADEMSKKLVQIGFQFVTVEPTGLRSGNLNQALVQIPLPDSARSADVASSPDAVSPTVSASTRPPASA